MDKTIKLSEFARKRGIAYITAHRWYKAGKIPGAFQMDTGSVFVKDIAAEEQSVTAVIYARVSNQSRKAEMQYQVDRCKTFCAAKGLIVDKVFSEVASGMNDDRKKLWLMLDSKPKIIVVEHKDRLTRFGFNYRSFFVNCC